jgi:hypothetical protein
MLVRFIGLIRPTGVEGIELVKPCGWGFRNVVTAGDEV